MKGDAIFPSLRLCNSFSPGWSKKIGPGSKQTFSEKNPLCKNPYPLARQEHLGLTTPTFDFIRVLSPDAMPIMVESSRDVNSIDREVGTYQCVVGINISNNELQNKLLLKNMVYVIINDKAVCLSKIEPKNESETPSNNHYLCTSAFLRFSAPLSRGSAAAGFRCSFLGSFRLLSGRLSFSLG